MMNEPLSAIMTDNPITVSPLDKLSKVKDILANARFHHVPVIKDKILVGIISSYDIFHIDAANFEKVLVEDVMVKKIVTLEPHEKIGAAAQVFLRHLFHGLPIVNDKKELVGIVTTHDVLRYMFDKEYPGDPLEKIFRGEGK